MNKLLQATALLVFLFLVATSSHAQFTQGTKAIGGGLGFRTTNIQKTNGNDTKVNAFDLNTMGGYLIQDNIEAGLALGFSSQRIVTETRGGDNVNSYNNFSVGPYARLYNPITDVVGLFAQAGFNAGFGGGINNSRSRSFDLGIRPGIILMVNENLGLEATVGYLRYRHLAYGNRDNFQETKTTEGNVEFSLNLSDIQFGFRLYLQ